MGTLGGMQMSSRCEGLRATCRRQALYIHAPMAFAAVPSMPMYAISLSEKPSCAEAAPEGCV